MNYYGQILSKNTDAKKLYTFLRKAMRQVMADRPFRGPNEFQEGGWIYQDESNGNVNFFSGLETIYHQDKKVFELKYHGGLVA